MLGLKTKFVGTNSKFQILFDSLHKEEIIMVKPMLGGRMMTSSKDKTICFIGKRLGIKHVEVESPVISLS